MPMTIGCGPLTAAESIWTIAPRSVAPPSKRAPPAAAKEPVKALTLPPWPGSVIMPPKMWRSGWDWATVTEKPWLRTPKA